MVNIMVSGLPRKMKYTKLLNRIRDTEGLGYVKQLHWKPLDGNLVQVILGARPNDAFTLLKALNGYIVQYNDEDYPLSCWQVERLEREGNQKKKRKRSKEHSPVTIKHQYEPEIPKLPKLPEQENHADDEIRALELKIELLKKQKILVEEEARLRVEQQKLNLLETFGPFDYAKLKKFEEIKDLNDPKQLTELANTMFMAETRVRVLKKSLPPIVEFLKTVLATMKGVVKKYVTDKNNRVLRALVRNMVKIRIKQNFNDKFHLPREEFIELYRSKYPEDTDDALLQEAISKIHEIFATINVGQGRQLGNTKAEEAKVTTVMDPDEVDVVDMENDLDDWIEDEKTEIKEENGVTPKEEESKAVVEEANNDVAAAGEADEVNKEVNQEDKASTEDTVKVNEKVTNVDENKEDGNVIIVDENKQ